MRAPSPTDPPDVDPPALVQVVLTDDAEISQLRAPPAHDDPDLLTVDEADDVGNLRPRQFLGADDDGDLGAPEPVADVTSTPSVPTPPPPVTADCTPKAWQAKNLPAFKDQDTLTDEFVKHFEQFPAPKNTPWIHAPGDFKNTEHCDTQPDPTTDPGGGLNKAFWHHMKDHGHDHDCPTREEIMNPLWLLFIFIPLMFWRTLANMSDLYQGQVYAKLQQQDIQDGKDVKRRKWEKLSEKGRWSRLVRWFGILVYLGAVKTGNSDHSAAWSTAGYRGNHGVYDAAVVDCMPLVEFEQMRRFIHFCDNNAEAEQHARDKTHKDYMPTQRMDLVLDVLNNGAANLLMVCDNFAIDEMTGKSYVFGPAGFMKRTPGKKTSQGFQSLAACSKMNVKFLTLSGSDASVGVVMCHAFLWDLTKGHLKLLDPMMNVTCNVVLRLVYMTVCRKNEIVRKNLDLFMDNRFAQPRLMVLLLAAFHVYCTCTIRLNYFPLEKSLRAKMIPQGWEAKTIKDSDRAAFREAAATLCFFSVVTMVFCFDQGFCKMATTRQGMDMQKKHRSSKQRRSFLDIIHRIKYALCRLFTDWMDSVDIEDHHRVMNREKICSDNQDNLTTCLIVTCVASLCVQV